MREQAAAAGSSRARAAGSSGAERCVSRPAMARISRSASSSTSLATASGGTNYQGVIEEDAPDEDDEDEIHEQPATHVVYFEADDTVSAVYLGALNYSTSEAADDGSWMLMPEEDPDEDD